MLIEVQNTDFKNFNFYILNRLVTNTVYLETIMFLSDKTNNFLNLDYALENLLQLPTTVKYIVSPSF